MRKMIRGICFLAIVFLSSAGALHAQSAVAELRKLDEQRMKAISDGDINAVAALIADDYIHVHATGEVMDKPGYLVYLQKNPRKSWRAPDAKVITHVYGDIAVMVGTQLNHSANGDSAFTLTLVWRKVGGTWKQVDAAYTALPAPKP